MLWDGPFDICWGWGGGVGGSTKKDSNKGNVHNSPLLLLNYPVVHL